MDFPYLSHLNEEQLRAVEHSKGPCIILAGAGSGKTRVLTYKAMYLLDAKKVSPHQILMLTFTNKAADEMKRRIKRYIAREHNPELITATTFHSFCARLLRRFGVGKEADRDFAIFDDNDQKDLMKDIVKESNLKLKMSPASLLYKISEGKNQLLTPADLAGRAGNIYEEITATIYAEYQKRLKESNALDFDDLLMETVKLFNERPHLLRELQEQYRYILIDEYQDTNHAQYVLARKLADRYKNISIVGDFSQSIYSWRGADFRNLQKFQDDFPEAKVFSLERNYRSTQPILDFAFGIISQNTTHPILKLWTDNNGGEEIEVVPTEDGESEALFVINKARELNLNGECSLKDMAVLYRTNAQSRAFEEVCLNIGLPYRIYGGVRFYERKEVRDIVAILRYLLNPRDKVSLQRIEKLGKRRSGQILEVALKQDRKENPQKIIQSILKDSVYLELYDDLDPEDSSRLENIRELVNVAYNFKTLTEFLDTVALIEAGYEFGQEEVDRLNLMTMHSAKGLEFSAVFIVGVEEGILPHSRSIDSLEELEEERRLFYVGITRARKKLFITYSEKRRVYGRLQYNIPSQFLSENHLAEF